VFYRIFWLLIGYEAYAAPEVFLSEDLLKTHQKDYFISADEIKRRKYKLNYFTNIKNTCYEYAPFIILSNFWPHWSFLIFLSSLQLLLAPTTSNVLSIFIYFIIFNYKNNSLKYIFNSYLFCLFLYLFYHSCFFLKIKEYHLNLWGIGTNIVLLVYVLNFTQEISVERLMLMGFFCIYSSVLMPHYISKNSLKIENNLKNDYRIYYLL